MTTDLKRESKMTVQDLALISEAILTILDDGKPLEAGGANSWAFYPTNGNWREAGSCNIAHRMEFVDLVQKYLTSRICRTKE